MGVIPFWLGSEGRTGDSEQSDMVQAAQNRPPGGKWGLLCVFAVLKVYVLEVSHDDRSSSIEPAIQPANISRPFIAFFAMS